MDTYIGLDAHSSSCTVATIGPSGKRLHSQVVKRVRLVEIHTTRYAIARRYMIRLRRDDGFGIGQETLDQPSPRIGPPSSIKIAVRYTLLRWALFYRKASIYPENGLIGEAPPTTLDIVRPGWIFLKYHRQPLPPRRHQTYAQPESVAGVC